MAGFLLRGIFNGITLVYAVLAMPGIFVDSLGTTLLGAIFFGLANAFIRPLFTSFDIPLDSMILGWTTLLTNIAVPAVVLDVLPGIEIHGLAAAFLLIAGLSLISYVLTRCIQDR